MCPTNDILPFCPTDTGSNLLSESDYAAATDRVSGNKPGIASAKLNNKALRQSAFIASQLAQFTADKTGTSVLDDSLTAKLLAQLNAALLPFAPTFTKLLSGTAAAFNSTYIFLIASGSATAAATYTVGGVTYTVKETVASGTVLRASGNAAPAVSGTLTKASGTGDATLTFYAVRVPLFMEVEGIGAGGGGQGSGTSAQGNGATGGTTSFGTSMFSGVGGGGGGVSSVGGVGGTATLGTGPVGVAFQGGQGQVQGGNAGASQQLSGGGGAPSPFGGAGGVVGGALTGADGIANTGSGGGGALSPIAGSGGSGGGAGGYFKGMLTSPSATSTWTYTVGAGGAAGATGVGGAAGGAGASGVIIVREYYQ